MDRSDRKTVHDRKWYITHTATPIISSQSLSLPSATRGHDPAQDRLHDEFSMIKYPSRILHLPTERIFTIDKDNLVGVSNLYNRLLLMLICFFLAPFQGWGLVSKVLSQDVLSFLKPVPCFREGVLIIPGSP